jgi:hypothetical protein
LRDYLDYPVSENSSDSKKLFCPPAFCLPVGFFDYYRKPCLIERRGDIKKLLTYTLYSITKDERKKEKEKEAK